MIEILRRFLRSQGWHMWGLWYLVIPNIIFLLFWLRLPYNALFSVLTIYITCRLSQHLTSSDTASRHHARYVVVTLLVCILLGVLSGAGGFVWQKTDWIKHYVVLNDLMDYRWPVNYGPGQFVSNTTLVYYLAYYLPSALVGKILGWRAAELGLLVQTILGLYIFAQLIRGSVSSSVGKFVLFFFLGGADILGVLVFRSLPYLLQSSPLHIEFYAGGIQYSSTLTLLMWVPQHALSGWVGTILAYEQYRRGTLHRSLPLIVAICMLWSPFVALGIVLVFVPFLLKEGIRRVISHDLMVSIAVTLAIVLYYASRLSVLPEQFGLYILRGPDTIAMVTSLVGFLTIDVGALLMLGAMIERALSDRDRTILKWSYIILLLLPLVYFGVANDFVMRTSIPALTIVFILIVQHLENIFTHHKLAVVAAVIVIVCGYFTPAVEISQVFTRSKQPTNERPTTNMIMAHLKYHVLHTQYMGLATRAFGRYLGNYHLFPESP